LGALGVPLVMGPFGGGETSPAGLRDVLRFKAKLTEWIRDLSNATITINPIVASGLRAATVLFVRTPDTQRILAPSAQAKSICFLELTLREDQLGLPHANRQGPKRLLYAGRLLYWKGVHIAMRAFAELLTQEPDAELTILGDGPEQQRLKLEAAAIGIAGQVHFISWVQRDEVKSVYDEHDLLVFPSLHDSGGTVVLEAISRGLPVICLDVGGPAQIISDRSGIRLATAGRTTAQVATAMASEMAALLQSPSRHAALSAGAVADAGQFVLRRRVAVLYDQAMEKIGLSAEAAPASGSGPCHSDSSALKVSEAVP
jgi:glycosyltransferase involved in cell wall biosynthesis